MFSLDDLLKIDERPEPFEPGCELWNDWHISNMMLEAHLFADNDAASYRPETILAICDYLPEKMGLVEGAKIIDLGCGPGLYCRRLSEKGHSLTGIDRAENSIRYARAQTYKTQTDYLNANYLEPFGKDKFDAAIMISFDFGVPSPHNRRLLLRNIFNALKPGGFFAFDVPSLISFKEKAQNPTQRWYASEPGFWRPHSHFVMEKSFAYEDIKAICNKIIVLDSEISIYRIWQTYFSPESISEELEDNGFTVTAILENLKGDEYSKSSESIGVICRRK